MNEQRITMGPFDLHRPIAEGGMGQVWTATHRDEGIPVAVKLLRPDRLGSAEAQMEREVRAHATLNHPGIVVLFDVGVVGEYEARDSEGQFVAGSRYLAMELADGGSLRDAPPPCSWVDVRRIAASVLDALSHAHAREVIHRDLKPENILLFGASPMTAKLADFGIAHAISAEHRTSPDVLESFAGTPFYVAPEQVRGQWRDYGPWTDLYALGCVVWELVCGHPPFRGHWLEVISQHLHAERPSFRPSMSVPPELAGWLHHAIARDPRSRFLCAADALAALPAASNDLDPAGENAQFAEVAPTLQLDLADTAWADTMHDATPAQVVADAPTFSRAPTFVRIPGSWRRVTPTDRFPTLSGAGLGLFGLREPPFVGRARERDILWRELRHVVETGGARAVFIFGEPGHGKSSLARWIATRADEVGAARRLDASHAPDAPAQTDGIPGLLRRAFRTWNLNGEALYQHLRPQLEFPRAVPFGDDDARLLTGWISDAAEDAGQSYPYPRPRAKADLLQRLLRGFTVARPAIVWLDDLQWGAETLDILETILHANEPTNVLFVATIRSDLVSDSTELQSTLRHLLSSPASTRLDLEPLPANEQRELITGVLELDEDLCRHIEQRAEGNPLFATQLLRYLVEQRALAATPAGFATSVEEPMLPNTIQELWNQRIDALLDALSPDERGPAESALQIAAALGRKVNEREWTIACATDAANLPARLPALLALRGLAHETTTGFEFTHVLLVDSLLERARSWDRLRDVHRSCANALASIDSGRDDDLRRQMEHRAKAGEYEEAIALARPVANAARFRGAMREMHQIIADRANWIEHAGLPQADPVRLSTLAALAGVWSRRDPARAASIAGEVLTTAREAGEARCEATALDVLQRVADGEGDFDEAVHLAEMAVDAAQQAGESTPLCIAQIRLGYAALSIPRFDRALAAFDAGLRIATDAEDEYRVCYCRLAHVAVALLQGDLDRALESSRNIEQVAVDNEWPLVANYARQGIALALLFQGRAGECMPALTAAITANRALEDDDNYGDLLFTQCCVLLGVGQIDAAEQTFAELCRHHEQVGQRSERGQISSAQLAIAAARVDQPSFDRREVEWVGDGPANWQVDRAFIWLAEFAAERWAGNADGPRERRAREIADRVRDRIGAP